MAIYRLKSKLYSSEFDKPKEKSGPGLGKTLLVAGTALAGYKMAGAGKFGAGAQNAVNSFRMKTSTVGSQRFMNAKNSLSTNQQNELMRFKEYGKASGMSAADLSTGKKAIQGKYANLMWGGGTGQAAVQASQAAAATAATQNTTP